jgi:hypothetical protein
MRVVFVFLIVVLAFGCNAYKMNTLEDPHYELVQNLDSLDIRETTTFAYQLYTNCYGRKFPELDKEFISQEFIEQWPKTEKELSFICNDYGHRIGKPTTFALKQVVKDQEGNRYYAYKVSFKNPAKTNRFVLIKNRQNLISSYHHTSGWKRILKTDQR